MDALKEKWAEEERIRKRMEYEERRRQETIREQEKERERERDIEREKERLEKIMENRLKINWESLYQTLYDYSFPGLVHRIYKYFKN